MTLARPLVVHTVAQLRAQRQSWGSRSVGFVPTMGYLHQGHASLLQRARAENDRVILSIFVNPMQFGANEDLGKYPRDLERDLGIAQRAGVDTVFHPEVSELYPPDFNTRVSVQGVGEPLDGAARPGHFVGVATVVLKLLNLVQPARAYFGEKDWQQLAVIRRLVEDLAVPCEVVGVPTVREASGLAMSSRNSYLSPEQQARAAVLSGALRAVQAAYASGERHSEALRLAGLRVLQQEPEVQLEYLSVVDQTMREPSILSPDPLNRVLIAARLFGVRLIDNMSLSEEGP